MAGPTVQFKITTQKNGRFNTPGDDVEYTTETSWRFVPQYSSGQIIFVEDLQEIYVDFHNYRKRYSTTESSKDDNVRYLGISDNDPTLDPYNPIVRIKGNPVTAKLDDIIAYGNKEYMWRAGEDDREKWYELGNEDSPSWEDNAASSSTWSED